MRTQYVYYTPQRLKDKVGCSSAKLNDCPWIPEQCQMSHQFQDILEVADPAGHEDWIHLWIIMTGGKNKTLNNIKHAKLPFLLPLKDICYSATFYILLLWGSMARHYEMKNASTSTSIMYSTDFFFSQFSQAPNSV